MVTVDGREGKLTVDNGQVSLTVYDGLGLSDVEMALSDVDSVNYTRSTFTDEGMLTVNAKGVASLQVTIPNGRASQVLKALAKVVEDAKPDLAETAEKR